LATVSRWVRQSRTAQSRAHRWPSGSPSWPESQYSNEVPQPCRADPGPLAPKASADLLPRCAPDRPAHHPGRRSSRSPRSAGRRTPGSSWSPDRNLPWAAPTPTPWSPSTSPSTPSSSITTTAASAPSIGPPPSRSAAGRPNTPAHTPHLTNPPRAQSDHRGHHRWAAQPTGRPLQPKGCYAPRTRSMPRS
jgi:hypothetical protein